MPYTTLQFTRSSNGAFPSYSGTDSATGSRYTIEQFGDGKKTWHLSYVNDTEVNERGNCPVAQIGRYATMTDAVRDAQMHLEGIREDRAQRTVAQHVHREDGSVLDVFTNGYTRLTEVILNDEDGTARLVLDRDQVAALHEALGRVLAVQQEARQAS